MSSPIPSTTLAGKQVGRVGYGLMQLTWSPKPPSEEDSFKAMKAAADAGATAWSTASFYGQPDFMANIKLIGKFFKKYPEYIDKIVIVCKGGMNQMKPDSSEEWLRSDLKEIKSHLGEKDIDVFSLARLDSSKQIEDVWKTLLKLQQEGLFGAIGASEMKASSLKRAEKIAPIAILEIEVSLWSYEEDIRDAIEWSKSSQVPIFAYSPLGRGFLTRTYKSPEDIPEGSFQRQVPRFQGENFYKNLELVDKLDEISEGKGITTAQLALGWILSLSPYMIPIPGSSNPVRAQQNIDSAKVELTEQDKQTINKVLETIPAAGGRYDDAHKSMLMQ